jgi:hypothetical protein
MYISEQDKTARNLIFTSYSTNTDSSFSQHSGAWVVRAYMYWSLSTVIVPRGYA